MEYHWLLLKNGTLSIGTRGDNRMSWAVLMPNGTMTAVNDHAIDDHRPVKKFKFGLWFVKYLKAR